MMCPISCKVYSCGSASPWQFNGACTKSLGRFLQSPAAGSQLVSAGATLCLPCSFVSVISAGSGYSNAFQRVEVSDSHASCRGICVSFLIPPVAFAFSRNPQPELGTDSFWHKAVAESTGYQISLACPPIESNTIESSNTLLWHGIWVISLIQPVLIALNRNPFPEVGVPAWHKAVPDFVLECAHLFKMFVPSKITCPPIESNTIECSNTLLCYVTWLSLLVHPVLIALMRNPCPEFEVGSVLMWHETVAELHLVFTQLSELVAPFRVSMFLIFAFFKSHCIETWLVIVLALAIRSLMLALAIRTGSLMHTLFGLIFITLAHGEC